MAPKKQALRPGQRAPASGQYAETGPRGGKTGAEVTAIKDKRLPPTSKPGNRYVLTDPTKHKSKR